MISILDKLMRRGLVHHCSDAEALSSLMKNCTPQHRISCYLGVDCTAQSLHVGHVVPLMLARWLLRANHRVVILLGGATTRIGDPTGKDKTRPQLDDKQIKNNALSLEALIAQFLRGNQAGKNNDFTTDNGELLFANNASWLDNIKYIDFLRDYGKYFSVNDMLTMDSVRDRLNRNQPMNFVEFNYVLLQSYDFLELSRDPRYNCILQIGGSDQWGNMSRGISLAKRFNKDLYTITTPLLTTSDGRKMGKTESGAVWLDKTMLAPCDYYQFFRNVEDDNLRKWLLYFTHINEREIDDMLASKDITAFNAAKCRLAYEATLICHGQSAADEAHKKASAMFDNNMNKASIETTKWPLGVKESWFVLGKGGTVVKAQYDQHRTVLPTKKLLCKAIFREGGINRTLSLWKTTAVHNDISELGPLKLANLLIMLNLADSAGKAKDLIRQGAVRLGTVPINDPAHALDLRDFAKDSYIFVSVGKKNHGVLLGNGLLCPYFMLQGCGQHTIQNLERAGVIDHDLEPQYSEIRPASALAMYKLGENTYEPKAFQHLADEIVATSKQKKADETSGQPSADLPTHIFARHDAQEFTASTYVDMDDMSYDPKSDNCITSYVEVILQNHISACLQALQKSEQPSECYITNPGRIEITEDKMIITLSMRAIYTTPTL